MSKYQIPIFLKSQSNISYIKAKRFPNISYNDTDIYIITQEGDRYDLLASDYYQDSSKYWIIPIANNLKTNTLFPIPGAQLRIPIDINAIIKLYNDINF